MYTKHFTKLMLLVAVISATLAATAMGQVPTSFRGIPLPQDGNDFDTPTYGLPMFADIVDSFARDGGLADTVSDAFRTGYVPPFELDPAGNPVPNGPLTGVAASLAGRWMPETDNDYVTSSLNGGSVSRMSDEGHAVACVPWRVTSDLGRGYLIEMNAIVAEGETATLGYFGDVNQYGTDMGLDSQLGQLVLGVSRGTAAAGTQDQLTWTIAWDDDGERRTVSGSPIASFSGEEVRMQIRWDDVRNSGNDLFNAWVQTSNGQTRLASGDMSTEIEVFGAGFELSGTGTTITNFVTAVPEPSSMLMGVFGAVLLSMRLRRRS